MSVKYQIKKAGLYYKTYGVFVDDPEQAAIFNYKAVADKLANLIKGEAVSTEIKKDLNEDL